MNKLPGPRQGKKKMCFDPFAEVIFIRETQSSAAASQVSVRCQVICVAYSNATCLLIISRCEGVAAPTPKPLFYCCEYWTLVQRLT